MIDFQTSRRIGSWLMRLRDVMPHASDRKITPEVIEDYVAALGERVPSGAFTDASRAEVSGSMQWFPGPAELAAALNAWWRDHRPARAALTGPAGSVLEREDMEWVGYWRAHAGERSAGQRRLLLGLVREQSFPAYLSLVKSDNSAADVAVKAGWPTAGRAEREMQLAEEWGDAATVRSSAKAAAGSEQSMRLLRALVGRWAPENLDVLDGAPPPVDAYPSQATEPLFP